MFDYKANPFYLNDNEIKWVEDTYEGMSLEEKLGQLFCPIVFTKDEKELKELVQEKHIGGMLYREGPGEELRQAHKVLQDAAKIPLLTASNLEYGGNGSAIEGTYFGREMLVAATQDTEKAYQLGKVSCSEGAAVGVNWSFAPVVDLDQNYHNPITNVRTFGNDQQTVINMGKAYIKAAQEEGVATSVKHFPGDGVDERDQHLLTSVNSLSCEEWDKTYGKIYEEMIEAGMEVPYSFAPAYMNRQRAAVVGSLGICYYREGKFETAAEHKPDYLRISQAERERAEKEKNAKPEVRGMTIEDGAAVAEMEHQSFSDAWSEKAVLETLRQPTALCLVAEKAGRRVGYLLAYQAADEIEIARVAVVEEVKRQGVGTALMKKLQEEGTQRKARKILLDVREKNHMAQAFYEKIGFKEDGIRKRFYTEPEEDAVLMSMQISG